MGIPFLIKGLLISLSMAAPIGPIAILCMNRALITGPRTGFICGLGAALAEALYALGGAIALAAIAEWIIDDRTALQVTGGVFLVYLGARTFMRPVVALPSLRKTPALPLPGARGAFHSTFLLTLANPVTLLGFAAVFAGLGITPGGLSYAANSAAAALVLGVFLGSALWWLALSSLIGRVRKHMGAPTLTLINRVSGTVLTAFGIYAIATLLPML